MVSTSPLLAKMKNNIGAGNLVRALVALHDVDKNITTRKWTDFFHLFMTAV